MKDIPAMHYLVLISIVAVPILLIGAIANASNNRNSFEGVRVGEFVGDWTRFDKLVYGFDSYEEYKADQLGMSLHDYLDSLQDNPIMFPVTEPREVDDLSEEMASDIVELFDPKRSTDDNPDGM